MPMPSLSVIVITYNEESNIKDCLESVKSADEIILIDSGSTDRTVEEAKELTSNIISVDKQVSYGLKRNIGIEKANNEWILWLDADERVTPELWSEIHGIIDNPQTLNANFINRKSFFITKFINHCGWYPDYTLRLFRKSTGIRFNDALVHEKISYSGETGRLKHDILHYTDRTFEHYFKKLNIYTTLSARELFNKGKKAGFIDIILRPVFTFFKMYFLKLGLLDGFMGLVLCILSSCHVMVKYLKLYQLNKKELPHG